MNRIDELGHQQDRYDELQEIRTIETFENFRRQQYRLFSINEICQIPIASNDKTAVMLIVEYVDEILERTHHSNSAVISDIERKIDCAVYQLYGLTYDEVKIIDPATPIIREGLEN